MDSKEFKLSVITPEGLVFDEAVDLVVVPGVMGEFGVLARHTSLMAASKTGVLRVHKGGTELFFAISASLVEVRQGAMLVLADQAVRCDELGTAQSRALEFA